MDGGQADVKLVSNAMANATRRKINGHSGRKGENYYR
jgi:hypothetical protein